MFARSAVRLLSAQSSAFSTTSTRHTKVAVLGAGGGIGQSLSMLLKIDPLVSSLSLYDIRGAPGVAADVSHIDTPSSVSCRPIRC
jgi:malate dehydrogenase